MRPTRRVIATGVVAMMAGTLAPALPQSAGARQDAPETYRFLRAQVFTAPGLGSIAVGMPNDHTVKVQRLNPATGAWSRPRVLFTKHNVTCGEIDGSTSPGGIALTLQCDTPFYEDPAPTHSVAMVTRDLRTWSGRRIPGESYRPPGISPSRYSRQVRGGGPDRAAPPAPAQLDVGLARVPE